MCNCTCSHFEVIGPPRLPTEYYSNLAKEMIKTIDIEELAKTIRKGT